MSDSSYKTTFGPSTPGAINLISGQTHGTKAVTSVTHDPISDVFVKSPDANGVGTVVGDPDPAYDDCSDKNHTATDNLASQGGKNIPRLPLEVISPFSKVNYIDHTRTDQTSILKFIEDNWSTGQIGDGSYDERAGDLSNMLDFKGPKPAR
jgi:hypothetical protein